MNGNTPDQAEQLEFFMDEIVIAICLRTGNAYEKAQIIKKAADKYYAQQPSSQAIEKLVEVDDEELRKEFKSIAKWHTEYVVDHVQDEGGEIDPRIAEHAETTTVNHLIKFVRDRLTAPNETGRKE